VNRTSLAALVAMASAGCGSIAASGQDAGFAQDATTGQDGPSIRDGGGPVCSLSGTVPTDQNDPRWVICGEHGEADAEAGVAGGGAIVPGTYVLSSCQDISRSESSPWYFDVLHVTDTTIQHAGAGTNLISGPGVGPYAVTWSYVAEGSTLHITPLCSTIDLSWLPDAEAPFDIGYTADSHSLTLYGSGTDQRDVPRDMDLPGEWSKFTR
jgi:hypothetical protein